MKRNLIYALIVVLALPIASCGNSQAETQAESRFTQKTYDFPEYITTEWDSTEMKVVQCEQDQWMRVPDHMKKDSLVARLVDAYNANVVWHSVRSDMETFWRMEMLTDSAMLNMDLTNISDEQTHQLASALIEGAAAWQRDTTLSSLIMEQYLEWVTIHYNASTFFDEDSITEDMYWAAMDPAQWVDNYEEIKKKRGQSDTILQQQLVAMLDTTTDFNTYCVLAIEYAHWSEEGPWATDALPYLEKALTAGIYSPLFLDLWLTWRAMRSTQIGLSKDAYIPNAEYNQIRLACCYTMLCHIHEHPDDWLAINGYLNTSYWDNIGRYGPFAYGNQSISTQLEVFPEWADKILSE